MRLFYAAWLLTGVATAQALGGVVVSPSALQQRSGYAVVEIHDARGDVVRKFVAPGGVIFAVAWRGPAVPDLHALLGSRFAAFHRALVAQQSQRPRRRGPLYVAVDDLVVQNSGHMRAFAGRAWLTDALPRGLSAEVIH